MQAYHPTGNTHEIHKSNMYLCRHIRYIPLAKDHPNGRNRASFKKISHKIKRLKLKEQLRRELFVEFSVQDVNND